MEPQEDRDRERCIMKIEEERQKIEKWRVGIIEQEEDRERERCTMEIQEDREME